MATKTLPDQDVLLQLLRYDADTGKLFWRDRGVEWFNETPARTAADTCRKWNTRYADTLALGTPERHGCTAGHLLGKTAKAHRVVWKMVTGAEPEHIDHINGDPADNRIENLRSVSRAVNNKNVARNRNNKSGASGVRYDPCLKKWRVLIGVNGQRLHVGVYNCFTAALIARKAAEIAHDFHPNHGRAA
jgi:hypothetical protein